MEKKNYEREISNIKGMIDQRYGEQFDIEYFLPAKDKTYDNILTLSNRDGVVFNAYQSNDDEIADDYPEALINTKLTEYITSSLNISSNLKVRVLGVFKDGSVLTIDFAKSYVPSTSNKEFIKLVTVVAMDDEISKYKEELFNIYNVILKFESNIIEFEVVSFSESGDALLKVLNNPLGYYNNNWNDFKEITSYIDITSKNIATADELMKEIK